MPTKYPNVDMGHMTHSSGVIRILFLMQGREKSAMQYKQIDNTQQKSSSWVSGEITDIPLALQEIGFTLWRTEVHCALAPLIHIATGTFSKVQASLGHPLKYKNTLFSSANCSHWLHVLAKVTTRTWKTGRRKLWMIWKIKAHSHMKWRTVSSGNMYRNQHLVQLTLTGNNKDGVAILCWEAESAPRALAKKRLQTLNPASKYPCQQHLKGFSLSTFQWRGCQINSPSSPQSKQRLRLQTLARDSAEDGRKV